MMSFLRSHDQRCESSRTDHRPDQPQRCAIGTVQNPAVPVRANFSILRAAALLCGTLVLAVACAQSPGSQQTPPEPAVPERAASGERTSPPDSAKVEVPVPQPPAGGALQALDRSCTVDADCAVKNVGNCCGMLPACVNVGAEPDPARVQADCAASGLSSICGFQELAGCQCVESRCEGIAGGSQLR